MINRALSNKEKMIVCDDRADKTFVDIKTAFASRIMLSHFDGNAKLTLTVDVSCAAIGGMLQQVRGCVTEPSAFFSKKLTYTDAK